jgi:hypothetical protein
VDNDVRGARSNFDSCVEYCQRATEQEAYQPEAGELLSRCKQKLGPLMLAESDIDFYEKEMAETTDPATDSEFKEKLDNRKQALELLKREFNEWADEAGIYEDVEVESAAD